MTHKTNPAGPTAQVRLRILFGDKAMIGPGKAALLELIRDTGSISAAGRAMQMSYKRAWTLVEDLNAAFLLPLVESARGGHGGGGAHLTEAGAAVVRHYRAVEAAALTEGGSHVAALKSMLRDIPDGK